MLISQQKNLDFEHTGGHITADNMLVLETITLISNTGMLNDTIKECRQLLLVNNT